MSKIPSVVLLSFALFLRVQAEQAQPVTWAHEKSDIKPDPALLFGKLDSGFRYVLMHHPEPPGRLSLRLYVHAGSLNETEEQRGLAHFIEHMAFNGTKNYPSTEIVKFLQRLGVGFGADINAHTSFDETVYKLDLPDVKEETLAKASTIMRDWSDGMTLDPAEIEKERGVILQEKLGRDSARFRMMEAEFNFLFPKSLIPQRMPIGLESVIKSAGREQFSRFYNSYYRPERMIFVAVGDVPKERLEKLTKDTFSGMKPLAPAAPAEADLGSMMEEGLRAKVHVEAEAPSTQVSVSALKAYEKSPDTSAKRSARFPLELANQMLNERLSILAKKDAAPFSESTAATSEFFQFAEVANVELSCQPEQWKQALAVAEQEIRRAVQHGFTKSEFKQAKAETLNRYEREVQTAATRKSASLANDIVQSFGDSAVFSSPEEDLRLAKEFLDKVSLEACQTAFRDRWSTPHVNVMLSGNLKEKPSDAEIAKLYQESAKQAVDAPKNQDEVEFAYTNFGTDGQSLGRQEQKDLGITQLIFSNGVRANLKPTDFKKNTIAITARFGGGQITMPKDKPGLDSFAGFVMDAGGLVAHSSDDLERIFAGKTVQASFSVDEDAFRFSGRTSPKDLLDQLQLMCAHFVAAGYREEAESQIRKMLPTILNQLKSTPEGQMQARVDRFIHGDDPRFGVPLDDSLSKLSLKDVKDWLEPALKKAPLEVSIVGDFTVDAAIAALSKTFGALPERDAKRPTYEAERKIRFPTAGEQVFPYTNKINKAITLVYWPTTDRPSDVRKARRLSALGAILTDRVRNKIREELGEAYSPRAQHVPSDVFPGYGYLLAMSPGSSDKAKLVADSIAKLGDQLAAEGTNADELNRALKPLLTSLKEQRRDNDYWLNTVLASCQEDPRRLDWARSMEDDFAGISVEDINALAKEYMATSKALRVIVRTE